MEMVINLIKPQSLADVFIYAIFFCVLGVLFTMPEKNEFPMYLLFAIIFCCIIDLMRTRVAKFPIPGADNKGFFTFIIHIGMSMLPFVTAGMIRRRGKKGAAAVPLSILAGIIACLYALLSFMTPDMLYGKF